MNRLIAVFMVIMLSFSLVGCKSKAERELEQARNNAAAMQKAADQARQDYEDFVNAVDAYEQAVESLK